MPKDVDEIIPRSYPPYQELEGRFIVLEPGYSDDDRIVISVDDLYEAFKQQLTEDGTCSTSRCCAS
jgi:hypothetical protein